MNYSTKTYKHLNKNERFFIETLYNSQKSMREIAKTLKRSISTISREIRRNTNRHGFYRHEDAQRKANKRIYHKHSFKWEKYRSFTNHFKKIFKKDYHGVEASVATIKKMRPNILIPSVKQIYNWINKNIWVITQEDKLRKRYRRGRAKSHFVNIPQNYKFPIWTRPKKINSRKEFGHWEADLVMGKKAKGHANLLVMTERKSRLTIACKVKSKHPFGIVKSIRRLQHNYNLPIKSITTDNGWEFKAMGLVGYHLKIKVYYCEPYASWQRGSNEHANGLIRRRFKKGTDFNLVSESQIDSMCDCINNMPRKMFGWKSAIEIYAQELKMQ